MLAPTDHTTLRRGVWPVAFQPQGTHPSPGASPPHHTHWPINGWLCPRLPGHFQLTSPAQIRQPLLECRRCSHYTHSELCRVFSTQRHNGMHNTLRTLWLSGLCSRHMLHLTKPAYLYAMQWCPCLSHTSTIRLPIPCLLRRIIQP